MSLDLQRLKLVCSADVYKGGQLAGRLDRTDQGGVSFSYLEEYATAGRAPVAFTLPLGLEAVESVNGALPPFFAGLQPEGHRLTVLKNAAKTSYDDELTLLLAVGADVPGDVQIVPEGITPAEPAALVDAAKPEDLDFAALAESVDLHGLPGVQNKASAWILTTRLALAGQRYLLKLDPAENPHVVVNEAVHLEGVRKLKLPVAKAQVVQVAQDKNGRDGLPVKRFDRVKERGNDWVRLPLEDGAQMLGLPTAAKYAVTSEELVDALAAQCQAPMVAKRNLYLQFLYAWLTGNGDLHAKNVSILGNSDGIWAVAPSTTCPARCSTATAPWSCPFQAN